MKVIKAKHYIIYVGDSELDLFDFGKLAASSFVIITDKNVDKLLASTLLQNPGLKGVQTHKIVVEANETSKSMAEAEKVLSQLAALNIDRQAVLIALGGGVVGDLTGFVASVYKRGVRFIQVPTTLLAQVDSSIGAKNGLNLAEGKNLIGTTYPPVAVIADTSILASLPEREIKQGLAEAIKSGVIWDKKIFDYIEKQFNKPSPDFYKQLTLLCIAAKVKITDKDPFEKGLRKIINYGHTVGHALEAASNHKISHGEAVALGMQAEGYIAQQLGVLENNQLRRQNQLIAKLGVTPKIPASDDELIALMRRDKKSKAGKLYFVMPTKIGNIRHQGNEYAFEASEEIVHQALSYLREILTK